MGALGEQRATGRVAVARRALLVVGLCVADGAAFAANLDEGEALFRRGDYAASAALALDGLRDGFDGERWRLLHVRSEMARGGFEAALESVESGLSRFGWSVPLRLLAREVYRLNGRPAEAAAVLDQVEKLVMAAPGRFAAPEQRVALGRYFLLRGADARKVLEQFFDVAAEQEPGLAEAHLAKAELALAKEDGALAARILRDAPPAMADDPEYHYLLAMAYSDGDRAASEEALSRALEINPNHVASHLLRADHRIDSERYDDAEEGLDRALAVNPREPRAWAYRAVLAHLRNDTEGEEQARREALASWAENPEVDHLIGRKLSRKYRFAEGASYQRKALEHAPDDLRAQLQLAQDLLRLGEDEGWEIVDRVSARDAYNVVAYNLAGLRDHLSSFRTLTGDGLIVRMDPLEADLYGRRVVELLTRARTTLGEKYETELSGPVVVEIFPRRSDFAVRTFGLPGADGLLGVCFGKVITANSPASQGQSPANWESVLWHEFCHTVTLEKTRNKMPRWLSEGISVYEEGQENGAWATALDPRFRERLLDPKLTPLSRLSSAFLTPETPLDLQFAYYESSLAVEFLVDRCGFEALKGLLDDLGAGTTIEESLPTRARMTLSELDATFADFARRKAEQTAPEATWEQPELPDGAGAESLRDWVKAHPKSFHGLRELSARLVEEGRWDEAREALERFKALDPGYVGAGNAYMQLAAVHRAKSEPAAERAALEGWAARDASAGPAFLRLMELAEATDDWGAVAENARRMLAVNPLIAAPHRQLARAAERLGDREEAIAAYRCLSLLDQTDPAEIHFRLAKLLREEGQAGEAKREVLRSLEEAPRFLDAHRLLLELAEGQTP